MEDIPGKVLLEEYGLNYFKNISTLGALCDDTLLFLLTEGEVIKAEEDDLLFSTGDKSDGFFIILDGVVSFYKNHHGKQAFIRDYKVGEHIGVVGMITLQDRVGDGVVKESGYVLRVSNELFHRLYDKNSQDFVLLLMNVVRDMARGLKVVDDIIVEKSKRDSDG